MQPLAPQQKDAILIGVGLAAIAVILSVSTRGLFGLSVSTDTGTIGNATFSAASSTYGDASSTATSTTTTPPKASSLTYTKAVNAYKDRRIQFDPACTMIPNQISFKNNTTVMLDNRSPSARSVYLDRVEYPLSGFGFKLVTLKKSPLPYTIVVDCGTGRNTGKIILQ